jgi:membrane fusion protein (multidrug efflux system)
MADMPHSETTAAAASVETPSTANPGKRRRLLTILGAVVVAAALIYGVYYFLVEAGRVSTDNAYVGADSALVTPLVGGAVADVRAAGMQTVKRGDILVVIDDADARIALASAQAALASAQQQFRQSSATVGSASGRLSASAANIAQARARLAEANATLTRANGDLARRQALAGTGAVSGEELSTARTAMASAQAMRDVAAAALAAASASESSAEGDLAATNAAVSGYTAATAPQVRAAQARVDQARLDLERTIIRAPIDGVIINKQVQIGQRVAPGAPLMTIVPVTQVFVDANFKESQFARLAVGQRAELTSDFYGSDVVFHGRVIGFAGGTGAAFSLIPAQNATGNWIKVVQRLPVRIAIDPADLRAHPLRVGLSMDVTVDTRER